VSSPAAPRRAPLPHEIRRRDPAPPLRGTRAAALDSLIGMFRGWRSGARARSASSWRAIGSASSRSTTRRRRPVPVRVRAEGVARTPDCPRTAPLAGRSAVVHDVPSVVAVPSYIEGVEQLPAATGDVSGRRFQARRYWALETFFPQSEDGAKTAAEIRRRVRRAFADSREAPDERLPIGSS